MMSMTKIKRNIAVIFIAVSFVSFILNVVYFTNVIRYEISMNDLIDENEKLYYENQHCISENTKLMLRDCE
jgi:CHASE3 domain sensor protein